MSERLRLHCRLAGDVDVYRVWMCEGDVFCGRDFWVVALVEGEKGGKRERCQCECQCQSVSVLVSVSVSVSFNLKHQRRGRMCSCRVVFQALLPEIYREYTVQYLKYTSVWTWHEAGRDDGNGIGIGWMGLKRDPFVVGM